MNVLNGADITMDYLRNYLDVMGDKIIIYLFDRAHFKKNDMIYMPGGVEVEGFDGSFLDSTLLESQKADARMGRFLNAGEIPFLDNLPEPKVRRSTHYPKGSSHVNKNEIIMKIYLEKIPIICEDGDDGHYGFSANADVNVLNSMTSRIHHGIFVADLKYIKDPDLYTRLVEHGDTGGMVESLTNKKREADVLDGIHEMGEKLGIKPEFIHEFYRDEIIPITKDVQVERFFEIVNNHE